MTNLPELRELGAHGIATVSDGPVRVGSELHFKAQLVDGTAAVFAQLADELAADVAIRRRYRRDVAALSGIRHEGLAAPIAWGPATDDGRSPWRIRVEARGESLETFLQHRGPLPFAEASSILSALCDTLSALHDRGLLVRDLTPAKIRMEGAGPVLFDIGLARVDLLSTRTASSLVLEGSPYAAPELLTSNVVDGRADVYALGVLAFRMLSGQLPHGGRHALLRDDNETPQLSAIVPQVQPEVADLVARMLSADPNQRPAGVRALAALLRGEAALPELSLTPIQCQSCAAKLPFGMRLCLHCGLEAVQYKHAADSVLQRDRFRLELRTVDTSAERMASLRELCAKVCEGPAPELNFLTGTASSYSKEERKQLIPLPVTLFADLDHETGLRLEKLFRQRDFNVRLRRSTTKWLPVIRKLLNPASIALTLAAGFAVIRGPLTDSGIGFFKEIAVFGCVSYIILTRVFPGHERRKRLGPSLLRLREGSVSTPASDPLVRQLGKSLQNARTEDLRQLLGTAATRVQMLVDHRAVNRGRQGEIDLVTEPVAELVKQLDARAQQIIAIDQALLELDEGVLVRERFKGLARNEPKLAQENTLMRLDRLRTLETERTAAMTGLLEAVEYMRRSVALGLRVQDEDAEHDRCIRGALAALQRTSSES